MKKSFVLFASALAVLSACNNDAETQSKKIVSDLSDFVDSVKKVTPEYSDSYWNHIEGAYENKEAKAEAVRANLDESARKDIDESKSEFASYKESYKEEKNKYEKKIAEDKKDKIRGTLFGEDKATSDLGFAWVNAANIAEVYKKFVDAVEANNTNYSKTDWEFIRDAFKSLDNRRDEISKEISGKNKLKITEQKVRFEAIKAVS